MKFKTYKVKSDLVVVGAGVSGICAAIEAARCGLSVSLINNRGCVGGNSGCELRVHICGADGTSFFNNYAREGGIIEELRLENLHRNPQGNVYLWDSVLMDFIKAESNIQLFLNTNIDEVLMDNKKIVCVQGSQIGSEKHFKFEAPLFVDDTGDGTIGYLAGAPWVYGREAKKTFNERIANDFSDEEVILSSLPFYSKKIPGKAMFEIPNYAKDIVEKIDAAKSFREIPDRIPGDYRYDGYRFQWYYEVGGNLNQITDNEEVINEHRKLCYGIWNEIKNSGKYDSDKYDLEYISQFPAKRESRRLIGHYIVNESDIENQHDFPDTIAHGGWSIDLHAGKGYFSDDLINRHYFLNGIYQLPYRSTVVKNVDNLFVASRCLSASHIAAGTIRLQGTLATVGQAVGAAASICKKYNLNPYDIVENKIEELQQLLLMHDQLIVGKKYSSKDNLINDASIKASSTSKCEMLEGTSNIILFKTFGFIIPVKDKINNLSLKIKVKKDTTLKMSLYIPKKNENYGPDIKCKDVSFKLHKNSNFEFIDFNLDCNCPKGKLFIEIYENPDIEIEITNDSLNGVNFYSRSINKENNFCSVDTLSMIEKLWTKLDFIPLFKTQDNNVYDVSNINNGFARNYSLPNIWLSDITDSKPTLLIDFKKEVSLSQIQIIFDSNFNTDYDNLETKYDFRAFKQIVKSYDIYSIEDGTKKKLLEVRDNYQRVNQLKFKTITTDKLFVEINETNGYERCGIYEIRAYK